MTTMTASQNTDIVAIMNRTGEDDALLAAWLGELDTPCAYWPTNDRGAFESALREWATREFAVADRDDDGHQQTVEEMVELYMAVITIAPPDVSDGDEILAARAMA